MELFLSRNAPHWSGYGRHIAGYASELLGREMSRQDLRTLEDRHAGPYRGTFGSMHDLSFLDPLDDEFKVHQARLRESIVAVEQAFKEYAPDEGRIRRLLIAIEESLLTSSDSRATDVRAVLSQHDLDIVKLRRLMSDLANESHFRTLLDRIEFELGKGRDA